ncbi:pentatricopeptide repeat-containing protein At2g34400 [Argentina anserina]|uniref:pentatricopeptide repeat-containing protein At2g34400 n=1 Tax=Argentina anserina TaxID=57926 RepID=UPI00217639CC|nr:pentatricopeptide repeat-containing protein At2g34400 [Potentilla anserina]XP_050386606.1 pentatricopeptide repeat-containing protein At2g34400 [Potentilla anserina]XP_050386608.1 pentatricopeptide repeat-containing protein At2g34400 [Potentilla anserina]
MLKPKPRQIGFQNPNNQFLSLTGKLLHLLKQCTSIKELQQIHTQMLINSIHKPTFLLPKLIDLKHFPYASTFFSHIPQPNSYAFNHMLRGLTTTWHLYPQTLHLYYQMKSLGLSPDNFTYPFLFISCWNLSDACLGRAGHCSVVKVGLGSDYHVCHSLITMYSMCGELGCARKVFDEIPERDSVSWNSMIAGYGKMGRARDAVGLFGEMREAGFEPNEMTLVSVLGACGDIGNLGLGKWVEEFVVEKELELNSYLGSALIGMYGKCGDLSSARRVFDSMKRKDRVTWNAMITGYAQNGMSNEAMMLFDGMKEAGVIPDKITLVGMLSACAAIGALDLGKWIDKYASERDFKHDIYVATALVDMYAKCGSLANALRVFDDMPQKNEVSWNAMISALAFHGRAREAISLFERMTVEAGAARPNDITFIAVLSACVHVGLVDEGRRLFHLMSTAFGLVPKVEHYSCMADLLSRAGHIHEAWDFIKRMPEKPDEVTLGALLGACRKCGNVDVTEQVVQLLMELEPSNSGNYVIPSNIYKGLKMWDDSARMRALMRQRGVSKTPGCSWIETENQLHEFHAGDNIVEISQVLQVLYEDLKDEGYKPDINAV